MRTIKFRAWEDDRNKMFENAQEHIEFFAMLNQDNYHIMQYTGLKDKKGVEIYEGDIVEYDTDFGDGKLKEEISFKDGGFFTGTQAISELVISNDTMEHFEVIGNIYDNPELLK